MWASPYCHENQQVSNCSSYGDKGVKNDQCDQNLWVESYDAWWHSVAEQRLGRVHSIAEIHSVEISAMNFE